MAPLLAAAFALLLAPAAADAQASPSPATSATRYDVMGRVTGTISSDPDAVGVGNPFLAVRNTYDTAGRLTRVETGTLATWQSEAIAPASWTGFTIVQSVATLYDAMSRKTRDTLREGSAGTIRTVTQYSYDNMGRLECTAVRMNPAVFASLPTSACTHSTYDPGLGRDRITREVYDAAGQRLQHRVAVGVTGEEAAEATWAYNLNGQVATLIDANGNRAELRYDGHGRRDRWTFPSTTRPAAYNDATQETALATAGSVNPNLYEGYSYDANGNRTNLRKRDGRNIAFVYDNLNRVTLKDYPDGGATKVFYSYDLQGLQLTARFTSQSGEGLTNAYDGFGRVATSSTSQGGTTRTLAYQYDRNGNRTRITHPDGTYFQYAYDWLNRVNAIREPDNDLIVYPAYDAPGRPSSLSFLGGGMVTNFTYDGVSRLSGLAHQLFGTAQDVTWTYTRNAASQLASAVRSNDAYAWTAHFAVNRPYTTNGLNQYSAAGNAAFLYDDNGNLTTDGTNSYTYDIENRLISKGSLILTYDPLGRLYQTANGPSGTTRYLYDGDALVAEYNAAGTLLRRYVHGVGADVPLIWFEGADLTQRRHLYVDHQGSIVAVGQPAATAIAVNTYDEYGVPGPANDGLFQYTGQIWLEDLGLYHYKARVYSPTLGRFMQTDPVGYEDQFNLYVYVRNDPVNSADPTGKTCSFSQVNGQIVYACQIDSVAVVRDGVAVGTRPPSAREERLFADFNDRYSDAVNNLMRNPERMTTVDSVRDGEGSFQTTSEAAGRALISREFIYSRTDSSDAAIMATAGGIGVDGVDGIARTYVFSEGLRADESRIVHEGGLHGTTEEYSGGLQRPSYPLNQMMHDRQYNDAACELLGNIGCE